MFSRYFKILLVIILIIAPNTAYAGGPIVKLSRGLTNIITSPLEYVTQTSMLASKYNAPIAGFGGFMRGTLFMLGRIIGGAIETVTFLVPVPWSDAPFPDNYEALMNPPTPLEVLAEQQGKLTYLAQ